MVVTVVVAVVLAGARLGVEIQLACHASMRVAVPPTLMS
jgi:hypothetical protein